MLTFEICQPTPYDIRSIGRIRDAEDGASDFRGVVREFAYVNTASIRPGNATPGRATRRKKLETRKEAALRTRDDIGKNITEILGNSVGNRLLFESVADILRKAIIRGDFAPGERLNEVAVSKALSLSRGPIREALRQLEQEGIVNLYPQRGGRVAEVSRRDVLDALAIRELLETMAAKETCKAITPEDIGQLKQLIMEMDKAEQADDIAELVSLDFRFHRELLTIASTETALRTWTMLGGKLMMFQSIGNRNYLKNYSVSKSHLPIIEALEEKDARKFRKVILQHIEENRSSIGPTA